MIRVENVAKHYGAVVAATGISFTLARGEVVGFLGPNGAGKSTVLKMISTWLPPSAGRIEVAGFDVEREPLAVRRSVGYLAEHNALYETMRVDRFLSFVGRLHGLRNGKLEQRLGWVTEKCALSGVLGKRIQECSKGYRQRLGLAAALLHDPPVLLLDEPTHGLDPLQVAAFREFITELGRDRAILFSSHILAEVVAICSRVLIINQGRMVADTTVAALREQGRQAGLGWEQAVLEQVRGGKGGEGE